METTDCKHQATRKSLMVGADVEECTFCHQRVRRPVDRLRSPTVTKLGRIGTKIVLPDPSYKLQMSFQDQQDLLAARRTMAKESQGPTPEVLGRQVEPGKRPEDPRGRVKWYQDHKKQMIEDFLNLGKATFLKKWEEFGITPQILSHLKKDPYYKKMVEKVPPSAPPSRSDQPHSGLPPLPPWSVDWVPEVQVRWLEIYEKLLTQGATDGTR